MRLINKTITSIKDFIVKNYFTFLVLMVVIFAFVLRYFHTKVGLPYLYNWDEPQTASTALKIMKTGDFNPHFFNYGSLMIYSNFVVDVLHYLSLMGHPSTSESYLTTMNEIKINADTGWHWTISHPSFYHWNRVLTALLGTGTVVVTYRIGKHVFNKWIGLIAAGFLATLPFHISQSAQITSDAPVAFFVLTVVLFSLLFIQYKKLSYFILSLVFVGIAIATKYNAAISMLIPLIALIIVYLRLKESVKTYMWFLIPLIPITVFFMIMPYAIIDLTTFLKDVGFEVRHYKINGHGGATSVPGWEHFSFQMERFYREIGLLNTILIGIGAVGIFFRPLFVFTLILPLMYLVYMSGMTVNFHRNFTQVYPFLALLFASGCYYLYHFIITMQKQIIPNKEWIGSSLAILVVLGFLVQQAYSSLNTAKEKYEMKDTRTNVINEINAFKEIKKIVIAKELRIHSQDLKRLKIPYSIVPLLEIASKPSDQNTFLEIFTRPLDQNTLFVLPSNITSFDITRDKKKLGPMQKFIAEIDRSSFIKEVGDTGGTYIDIYSVNPGIMLAKNLPIMPIQVNTDKPLKIYMAMCGMSKHYKGMPLGMWWPGSVATPIYSLKKNNYELIINAKGTKAFDEYAKLKIQVFKIQKDKNSVLVEKMIDTKEDFSEFIVPFEIKQDDNISFVISFINDKSNLETKEDRNVYLKSIELKRQ
ncbi:MAG: glycosyltransferase family 39 protein [Bacteroidales bacterium]|nr:glycosyltransferase family 39 protein [Bacteroidales bacterium]